MPYIKHETSSKGLHMLRYILISISFSILLGCSFQPRVEENYDTSSPAVSIAYPSSGQTTGKTIIVTGTAVDTSGIYAVYVTADGINYTNTINSLIGQSWSTTLTINTSGSKTIRAWAIDKLGNTSGTISVNITVDTNLPSISITYPLEGDVIYNTNFSITGIASATNSISSIQISTNGSSYFPVNISGNNWTNTNTFFPFGVNKIKARVITSDSKTNETPEINFTVRKSVWNVLVYLDADNNLEQFGIMDFNEMECVKGLGDGKINVLVLFDRITGYWTDTSDDWTGTRLYQVLYDPNELDDTIIRSKRVEGFINGVHLTTTGNNEELNMAESNTLKSFVEWAKTNYIADNTMVILWNHGDGWSTGPSPDMSIVPVSGSDVIVDNSFLTNTLYKGICQDQTSGGQIMPNSGVKLALYGKGIKVLGFDACLMGMLESVYEFRSLADYMIASPDEEPADGWEYNVWLYKFYNSSLTTEALVKSIIDSYGDRYSATPKTTLAAYKLSEVTNVKKAFEVYVTNLVNDLTNGRKSQHFSIITNSTEQYTGWYLHSDLWNLANNINLTGSTELKTAIENLVYYEWHNGAGNIFTGNPYSYGLSIYFGTGYPGSLSLSSNYTNNGGVFISNSYWKTYLTNMYN